LQHLCFRPFGSVNSIEDSIEDGGLDGNILNLLLPGGKCVVVVAIVGILLFCIYWVETYIQSLDVSYGSSSTSLGEDGEYVEVKAAPSTDSSSQFTFSDVGAEGDMGSLSTAAFRPASATVCERVAVVSIVCPECDNWTSPIGCPGGPFLCPQKIPIPRAHTEEPVEDICPNPSWTEAAWFPACS